MIDFDEALRLILGTGRRLEEETVDLHFALNLGTQYSFPNFTELGPTSSGMNLIPSAGRNSEMSIVSPI